MKSLGILSLALVAGLAAPLTLRAADSALLTLADARDLALKTHPRITLAQLRSLVSQQTVVEARAGFLPFLAANATVVDSGEQITRIASGQLSNSQIYDHTGVGATLNLLVTDFGRTSNLVDAAKYHARAVDAEALATRAQLLLEVDATYYDALKAQAVKTVAARTLSSRQAVFDRASALARNQLKSELEVRFAQVGVDEARLLVSEAEKNSRAALTVLANLMGQSRELSATRLEDPPPPGALPPDAATLTELALKQRPELARQRAEGESARALARAARNARLPTLSLMASGGWMLKDDPHFQRNYAAGGVNLNVPLFAGGLYRAKQREAELQARATDSGLQEQENNVVRDVRLAWLEAGTAQERIGLTSSLLENATVALSLARARFDQGLSSIVELNQAELAKTSAELAHATADYGYRVRRVILDYQTGSLR